MIFFRKSLLLVLLLTVGLCFPKSYAEENAGSFLTESPAASFKKLLSPFNLSFSVSQSPAFTQAAMNRFMIPSADFAKKRKPPVRPGKPISLSMKLPERPHEMPVHVKLPSERPILLQSQLPKAPSLFKLPVKPEGLIEFYPGSPSGKVKRSKSGPIHFFTFLTMLLAFLILRKGVQEYSAP